MVIHRDDGRTFDQIRPAKVTHDPFGYADASVLFEMGRTKILASVSLVDSVPRFLKGTGKGWLTAEYAMLPTSTQTRTPRESTRQFKNGRSVEISRLIGRSLRSVVNLDMIGERTITIDCDVLQADGGTRVASITAASLALALAEERWLDEGLIRKPFIREAIAAISVGMVRGQLYLDLSQSEDNNADADFNFVLTQRGDVIEIQGTSEKAPISWENFARLKELALLGVEQLFAAAGVEPRERKAVTRKAPLFSLGNR